MNNKINRRNFIKSASAVGLGMGLITMGSSKLWSADTSDLPKGTPNAEKLGWRLGCQAYSFKDFTLFEAIDKTASLGLKYIEAFPNQVLNKERSDMPVNESLPADARNVLKKKLNDSGIKLGNYGVCTLSKKEDDSRRVFDFAKDMGIETLVSEPAEESLEMLDKLCQEYNINISIHNHPKPSHYWNPDTVLSACKGHSNRIGACADTGHWMRSGLDPLESLKKYKGHIISLHFKDLNKSGSDAHDVPWGTGVSNAKAMLEELKRQKVKAVFSIEYEYHWDNSLPEIAKCVTWFDKISAELASDTEQ